MQFGDQPDPRLARAVRSLRERVGETQEDVAYAAGLTTAGYGRVERGEANPAWTTVVRIADGLGVSLGELVAAIERDG